jgi:8-oxo-dGTP pyrophosphatase MutT (NUDIX family)
MEKPTAENLDQVRKEGFRPGIVACLVNQERVLLVYKEEYQLWMLPQGGIENKEDPLEALHRTIREELGENFSSQIKYEETVFLDTDRMEFKPGRHSLKSLQDDQGNHVQMIGKEYYFCFVPSLGEHLEISETEYNDYFWLKYQEAKFIADRMYQKGKRRITLKVLEKLKQEGYIA